MAKRGGFGGGMMPGNMKNLMKQAQKMQAQMQENQKALEEKVFEETAGGGAVKIEMTGKHVVKSLKIDPEAVDPEDVETLEDMIVAAFNGVMAKIDEEQSAQLGKMTGGVGGGLGGGLF
jgi:DNA-binding YbaB/EbfC family protein